MRKSESGVRALRESLAPYTAAPDREGVTKLSISLPSDLAETLRATARESGLPVSAVIAAALRRALDVAEQETLDRALELDADDNLAWANAYMPIAAELVSKLEW